MAWLVAMAGGFGVGEWLGEGGGDRVIWSLA